MGAGKLCRVSPPKPVLVRDHGIWTGRLHAWEHRDGSWLGHLEWKTVTERRTGVIPADHLRPLATHHWVDAQHPFTGDWYPGKLIGWRRRPGYSWEGLVETHIDGTIQAPDWYPIHKMRRRDRPPPGFSDAY